MGQSVVAPLAGQMPSGRFAGVLFDMDGTLVDSMVAVERSWLQWAREFSLDPAALASTHGQTSATTIAMVLADRSDEERAAAHTRIRELEVADIDGVRILPGVRETFAELDRLGVPHAIVTSCERELAEVRIAAAGVPRPAVVVTASDVARGKPGPEPFERGAALLGLSPGECIVVEDATAGLISARAAGAGAAIAVTGTLPVEVLARDADAVYESVADIPWPHLTRT